VELAAHDNRVAVLTATGHCHGGDEAMPAAASVGHGGCDVGPPRAFDFPVDFLQREYVRTQLGARLPEKRHVHRSDRRSAVQDIEGCDHKPRGHGSPP
jgi:hypothetical protein